jgi:hypothetical protein
MLPENLIGCARLYDFYTNGISEGEYTHEAHVVLNEVISPAGTIQNRSAPSLMDLLNEENISPSTVDKEALEELLFNHPDPYDLAETDRLNLNDPLEATGPAVTRTQTVFAISEYIKLDSPALGELLQPSKESRTDAQMPHALSDSVQAGRPDDWSFDDFLS